MSKDDFGKEKKISALTKLLKLDEVSSRTAAKVLHITIIGFLELLEKYKLGFLETKDLKEYPDNA